MRHDLLTYLEHMQEAAEDIITFTEGATIESYSTNALLRSAVERKFMIIGEALARARDLRPAIMDQVASSQSIVGFRNRLVHGYETVRDETVWDAIHKSLPLLLEDIARLMKSPDILFTADE
jgi:uncharacterized protein with HEPN domain